MATRYEIDYAVVKTVDPVPTKLESVADTDPRLKASDPDKVKKLLEGTWDSLVRLGLVPQRIRIGSTVCEDLFQELASHWWHPTEFTPNVVGLRNGTILVAFDPSLAGNAIFVD